MPIRVGDADPAPRIICIPAATRLASIAAHIAISRSRIAFIASLRVAINASRISSSKISATTTIESAARAVDNTAALYLAVPEARRLLVLETLLPSLGEDELAYLGLGRRLRHASSQCTPDSLDEELDALSNGLLPLLPAGAAADEVRTAIGEARDALVVSQ